MSLACTSPTLRRLLLEPTPIHTLCTPAIRHAIGAAHCQLTTRRRRPWAHQTRFASNDPGGTPKEKDPYKVLGVPRNVSQRGLQKAYYEQAKKLHPDTSREDRTKFQHLSAAYEILKTPEAREAHDSKVRALERELERERAAQRARDAAAAPQAAQKRPQPKKSETSSGGSAKFVNRESLNWMKKYQRAKQEAEAQKEKDLAAQRAAQRKMDLVAQKKKDADAQKQKEMLDRQDKERRDWETALREDDKLKEPDQTNAVNTASTSLDNAVKSEPRSEFRADPKDEPSAGGKTRSGDDKGALPAQKSTVSPKFESLRVAVFSVGAGAIIEDVVKPLASSAIGRLISIEITPTGTAKLDFFTSDALHKLYQLVREGKFIVNRKKVQGMALHVSALPIPQDPNASRVLVLTDPCDENMPLLETSYMRFAQRQEGLDCQWLKVRRLSRERTEVHFGSVGEAERAVQILQNLIPGVHIRYGIDPATGSKEPGTSFLKWVATGEGLPDTMYYRYMRGVWLALCAGTFYTLIYGHYKQ